MSTPCRHSVISIPPARTASSYSARTFAGFGQTAVHDPFSGPYVTQVQIIDDDKLCSPTTPSNVRLTTMVAESARFWMVETPAQGRNARLRLATLE